MKKNGVKLWKRAAKLEARENATRKYFYNLCKEREIGVHPLFRNRLSEATLGIQMDWLNLSRQYDEAARQGK